jgi:hypothetical protein
MNFNAGSLNMVNIQTKCKIIQHLKRQTWKKLVKEYFFYFKNHNKRKKTFQICFNQTFFKFFKQFYKKKIMQKIPRKKQSCSPSKTYYIYLPL